MQEMNTSGIEDICRNLISASQGVLSWEWDSRFEAVLAKIKANNKESVREVLKRSLSNAWDRTNINDASEALQAVIRQLGGLMSGQLLFTSDPEKDPFLFCAWWPWGDGETISVRIAPACNNPSGPEKGELVQQFKGWFGV